MEWRKNYDIAKKSCLKLSGSPKGVALYFGGVKKLKKIVCDWPTLIVKLNYEETVKIIL